MGLLEKVRTWMGGAKMEAPRVEAAAVAPNTPSLKPRVSSSPTPPGFPLPLTEENIVRCFDGGLCPTCGAEDMIYEGPRGGASQNFMCGCCGQKLNMLVVNRRPLWGHEIGQDVALRAQYEDEGKTIRDRHAKQGG